MKFSRKLGLIGAGLFVVPLYTVPAHAYIDPGTASIVLQSIVGAIAAGTLFFRTHLAIIWNKLFPGRKKAEPTSPVADRFGDAG